MQQLERLKHSLEPYRRHLIEHPLYASIGDIPSLHLFMRRHVFAVWDFMSLLKSLQHKLTGTSIPWLPPGNPLAARLINEIVLGEESDEDGAGGYGSHFDLYYRAMRTCGCPTTQVDELLQGLQNGMTVSQAMTMADVSPAVNRFTSATFRWIENGNAVEIASAFTFGREDLLPEIFRRIVERLNREGAGELQPFLYYLDRHIELDEDRHGPMADRLICDLCGDDETRWNTARSTAIEALNLRRELWDEMASEIQAASQSVCEKT